MAKENKTQVSEGAPELVLENGETANDVVVNDAVVVDSAVETPNGDPAGEASNDLVKIRVLLSLAGKFLLPHDPGAKIEINANQANAIVDAGYGEFIVDESEKI